MSYYHQNPNYDVYAYEYSDNDNHSNDKYEYNSYSDNYEPDQYEPDHCEYEGQYPTDVDHEYTPQEYEQGHGESEDETQKPEELVQDRAGTRMDWEGEQEGIGEANEHRELEYKYEEFEGNDEMRKLEELERMANEDGYEHQELDFRYNEAQEPPQRSPA
jgi:hypothetical protein